jgi:hypothetical protein
MKTLLPDTNVLIDYGWNTDVRAALDAATANGTKFAIAPPTLTELSVSVVKGGAAHFAQNRLVFKWLQNRLYAILELPKPFMVQVVHSTTKLGDVKTHHQIQRIALVADSDSFEDFLQPRAYNFRPTLFLTTPLGARIVLVYVALHTSPESFPESRF